MSPAYQPYCPYAVDPRSDGIYRGPDLHAAQVLVAASWHDRDTGHGVGYRREITRSTNTSPACCSVSAIERACADLADYDACFAKVADSRSRVQMGTSWWAPFRPLPPLSTHVVL